MNATFTDQPTLWSSATAVKAPRLSAEESFAVFCRRNPRFMDRLAEVCYEMRLRGQRPSTKAAFEILRSEATESDTGWRLDNRWTSIAADRLCELYPDLALSIERRKRKS